MNKGKEIESRYIFREERYSISREITISRLK